MPNKSAEILNDVTKTLIDSQKGYEMAADVMKEQPAYQNEFRQRAQQRQQLVGEFQNQVRTLGEQPETDGGMTGAVHRGFTKFTSNFVDDFDAALNAIDDGEEHLRQSIEGKLKEDGLAPEAQQLLQKAHQAATSGERFAERKLPLK